MYHLFYFYLTPACIVSKLKLQFMEGTVDVLRCLNPEPFQLTRCALLKTFGS